MGVNHPPNIILGLSDVVEPKIKRAKPPALQNVFFLPLDITDTHPKARQQAHMYVHRVVYSFMEHYKPIQATSDSAWANLSWF
jgi:hypothetical protein